MSPFWKIATSCLKPELLRCFLLTAALIATVFAAIPSAEGAPPCCRITAINTKTGIVTASENSTGQAFSFKVSNSTLLNSLKVGQGVYANFATHQVSVDGIAPCCAITALGNISAGPIDSAKFGPIDSAKSGAVSNPLRPCCAIVSVGRFGPIDSIVTAQVTATGQTFQFKVNSVALAKSLKVGQVIYANFSTHQVSVDGAAPCCAIASLDAGTQRFGPIDSAKFGPIDSAKSGAVSNPLTPCCSIVSVSRFGPIDSIVTAQVTATGQTFQFKVIDAAMSKSLRVGQAIYANFANKQVSVDGIAPCCAITALGNTSTGTGIASESQPMAGQPPPSSAVDKNKPATDKRKDTGKTTLGTDGTVVEPTPEPTTEHAIRAATAAHPQGSANPTSAASSGTIGGQQEEHANRFTAKPTVVPDSISQNLQSQTETLVANSNPNQLPDLAAALSGGSAECAYSSSESCPQQCPPFTMKVGLGLKNLTPFGVSGLISVTLRDISGNTVRSWTVNGLSGNDATFPGFYSYPDHFNCPQPGTATLGDTTPPPPNFVLTVTPPAGVVELQTNNNSLKLYIPPNATISP